MSSCTLAGRAGGIIASCASQLEMMSPSIEYAGHPVYAEFVELGPDHWAQLVLQCRVRPDAITARPGSLGNKHWPKHLRFEAGFPTLHGLEWRKCLLWRQH